MISVIVNYIKEKSNLLYTIAVIGVVFYFNFSYSSSISLLY